jgi:hypothetical protein
MLTTVESDVHVTEEVSTSRVPSLKVPMAMNLSAVYRGASLGVTLIEVRTAPEEPDDGWYNSADGDQ